MNADPYREVVDRVRERALLGGVSSVLSWDQEVMMPPGGAEHRARELSLLARLAHERAVDPRLGELLEACGEPDDAGARANLRELRRSYRRAVCLPTDLVTGIAGTRSLAQNVWTEARQASEFARFLPWLDKLVVLMRRKAECLADAGGAAATDAPEPWDALAEDYEPGMRAADLHELFGPLRARLGELVAELAGGQAPDDGFDRLQLPRDAQEAFVRHVAGQLGFDFTRGRLDVSTHPFTGGSHCGDVRITTRFHDDRLLDALGSTMHEVGHGLYEQGLPAEHIGLPLGESVSLGIHESQSRLWENQVGRSRAFWEWCQPLLPRFFGGAAAGFDADDLFRCANRVQPSLIRVEADEATYNLHVMVRFELEVALIRGDLAAADLPGAWNDKYRDYLGIEVPDDRRGCLQDVHWSCGLFGYFPTYTLGNLYAAQFHARARADLPDLDGQFRRGEFGALGSWLRERIHARGQQYRAAELCEAVTGRPLSAEPFLDHLQSRLREVYRL